MGRYEEVMKRTEPFRYDRFGLFIHWGLYAVHGEREWVKSDRRMTDEEYQKYFDNFTAEYYDPKEWARLAKNAGMRYAVLTAKHHDGFCLFDSRYTDYKATNTPAGRDLVREYVDAFRAEGIKVGFYYSLLDWHHPDYPHCGDAFHPMRGNAKYSDEKRDFSRYIEYMLNQVRELCTDYGKIDIMWFDFSYDGKWGEDWKATKLVNMVRELQPSIVIDNRLGCDDKNFDTAPVYAGDFLSPEQYAPCGGMVDALGRPVPWEMCMTTQSDGWGYCHGNRSFMTARDIAYTLVDCVSKNGNLLLNVGPTSRGEIPEGAVKELEEFGRWMKHNRESIYGCGAADAPMPEWGRMTSDGKHIYCHFFDKSGYRLPVRGIKAGDVEYGILLSDNTVVRIDDVWDKDAQGDDMCISFNCPSLPDKIDTVVKLVMKKK